MAITRTTKNADPVPETPVTPAAKAKEKAEPEHRNAIAEWAVTILMLLFGTSTLLQAFVVPTGSMEKTVLIGDHLIVDKLAYAPPGAVSKYVLPYTQVKRGDVIVFRYPLDINQNYVKRVIGIPGDHIHIVNKQVFINGHAVDEPYKVIIPEQTSMYLNNFPRMPDIGIYPRGQEMLAKYVENGELVVPLGFYYAMGDNRDNSADSRFWGLVPRENIVGKPVIIFWSYDAPTEQLANGNIDIDHLIDIATHFFTKTRWERTFRIVRGYPLQ